MKKQCLIAIFTLFLINIVQGQQIDVSALYSSSSAKQFKNNWAYDLKYNHFIKKNRIGLSFRHYFYNTKYDDIYLSTEDGVSKYIEIYEPQNRRIALNLIYSYTLVENEKSNLYIGCNIGINYFHLQGEKTRIENGFINGGNFKYNYRINSRLGLGFLIEYEISKIFSERISTSIMINPELTAYEKFGTLGGYDPWLIDWLNFSIGLKYRFTD
ncbi:MAG: hypothetical protein QM212_04950 [Bacteroidota bacterium]|jgi:hypothetical protein|nr:hypothetical protein [Bacteroidota bacterium]HOD89417.1 hypothetical protein [Bacteroidales bacterium]